MAQKNAAEKSVIQKMQMKPGWIIRLVNAPKNAASLLGDLPMGAELIDGTTHPGAHAGADTFLVFANNRAELQAALPGLSEQVPTGNSVWVAYHKGTSKVATDIHRDNINEYAKTLGFVGNFMVSIDDDWAALRLKRV